VRFHTESCLSLSQHSRYIHIKYKHDDLHVHSDIYNTFVGKAVIQEMRKTAAAAVANSGRMQGLRPRPPLPGFLSYTSCLDRDDNCTVCTPGPWSISFIQVLTSQVIIIILYYAIYYANTSMHIYNRPVARQWLHCSFKTPVCSLGSRSGL